MIHFPPGGGGASRAAGGSCLRALTGSSATILLATINPLECAGNDWRAIMGSFTGRPDTAHYRHTQMKLALEYAIAVSLIILIDIGRLVDLAHLKLTKAKKALWLLALRRGWIVLVNEDGQERISNWDRRRFPRRSKNNFKLRHYPQARPGEPRR